MSREVPSLQRRLAGANVAVLGAALCVFSLLLHAAFTRALSLQFRDTLAAQSRAVASLVEHKRTGGWEVETASLAGLAQSGGPDWFQVWGPGGAVIVKSANLGDEDLPREARLSSPFVRPVVLAGGKRARLYEARELAGGEARRSAYVTVAVAKETDTLDRAASLLWVMLGLSGLTTLVLATLVGVVATRRGLAPVGALASGLEAIDDTRLELRLPEAGLPGELRPVVLKLNALLSRLEAAFHRERQFSADVSHELRTPLAGLRSILEVSAMRERPAAEHRAALQESLEVVGQMHGVVERLLLLARLDARQLPVEREAIALRGLVEECFAPFAARARERGLRFDNRVAPEQVVESDREKLRLILTNLLGNATDYTEEGGWVSVSSDSAGGALLEVEDSGPPIPEPALERIFERFYRADASRAGTGEHSGIGLALVRSLCVALGAPVRAENRPGGRVAFVVGRAGGGD